jgi:hypothetical protein
VPPLLTPSLIFSRGQVSKYIADSDNSSRALGVEELSNYDLVSMKLEIQCVFCKKFIRNGNGQWCKGCKQFTQKCGVCEQVRLPCPPHISLAHPLFSSPPDFPLLCFAVLCLRLSVALLSSVLCVVMEDILPI